MIIFDHLRNFEQISSSTLKEGLCLKGPFFKISWRKTCFSCGEAEELASFWTQRRNSVAWQTLFMSMGLQEELSPADQAAATAAAERAQSRFTELPKTPHKYKDIRKVDDQQLSPVKHEVHIKNPLKSSSSKIADVKGKDLKRALSFSEACAQGQLPQGQGSRPTFGKPPVQEGILKPAIKRELPELKKKEVYTDSEDDEKLLQPSSDSEDCICPTDHT